MDERFVGPSVVAAFVALVVLLFFVANRSSKRRQQQEEMEHTQELQRLQEIGRVGHSGEPLCIICQRSRQEVEAVRYMPTSGIHWFDDTFIFSWLNRLWALPPKYVVSHKYEMGPLLCEHHWRMAVDRLNEVHDMARSRYVQLKHEQSKTLKSLDEGGLLKYLEDTVDQMRAELGLQIKGIKFSKNDTLLLSEASGKEKPSGVEEV